MKRIHLLALAILSGLLLGFSWPVNGFTSLLFIALIPLLYAENYISNNKHLFSSVFVFNISFISFLIWNCITTYWIYYSTFFGAFMAVVLNSLFFSITFTIFHHTKNKLGTFWGYLSLIIYWLAFEHLHMDWDLSWPWLTLGNGFSTSIKWIQWYEYTGTIGGSLWILITNILLLKWIINQFVNNKKKKGLIYLGTAIITTTAPILFSYQLFHAYKERSHPIKVVVVQPNIDPYNEKYGQLSSSEQLQKIINLANKKIDATTDYILAPETAIPVGIWEDEIYNHWSIDSLKKFNAKHPHLRIILGLSTYRMFSDFEKPSPTARNYLNNPNLFYDAYNSALQYCISDSIQIYHKSRLVPGVEKMPFPQIFKSMEKFAIDLGGIVGSLGSQKYRTPFFNNIDSIKIAPVICYESIYGDFIAEYVKNGANLIFIMTNDGWWNDTPGYKQHNSYAALRAIETRRSIARSANTGISCFYNQKGEMSYPTQWWQDDVIHTTLNANNERTFYVKYGSLYNACLLKIAYVFLLITFIKSMIIKYKLIPTKK